MDVLWGVLAGVAACAVSLRWGVWRWLAVVGALPALLVGLGVAGDVDGTSWALVLLSSALLAGACWRPLPPLPALGAVVLVAAVLALAFRPDADPGGRPLSVLAYAGLFLALLAASGLGRARPTALRLACLLVAAVPLVIALVTGDSRTPVLLAWGVPAGALGLTALLRGRRGTATARPQRDSVDDAALAAYDERYGDTPLAPVAVVIAAYNEADGIPAVLDALPHEVAGLAADIVVVDDGSSDGTAEALAGTRARVVLCPANRGQGAALRLGYRVAREHGAHYVITTDADGQYDVGDFPAVLAPILDDRADFVTGSRILGRQHTRDRVRRTGVHVFAWLATLLTGRRSTDTSFGLRAMRSEVTGVVTLNQPQYQSSELLLGVLSHGFRVVEVPGTMHVRSAGASKKGKNLVYGSRYARVMTGTWWREGCPRPVTETAPAFRQTREHASRG